MGIILVTLVKRAIDREDTILGLIDDMAEHSNNIIVLQKSCQKLVKYISVRLIPQRLRYENMNTMSDAGLLDNLVSIMETQKNEVLLRAVFDLLRYLALHETIAERMYNEKIVDLMESIVQANLDDSFLSSDLETAMERMTATFLRIVKRRTKSAIEERNIEMMFTLMYLHPDNTELQLKTLSAMTDFTKTTIGRQHFRSEILRLNDRDYDITRPLIQTASVHLENVDIVEKLAVLLHILSEDDVLCSILGKNDMVASVLAILHAHQTNRPMVQFWIFSLNSMLKLERNKNRFLTLDGPKKVLEIQSVLRAQMRKKNRELAKANRKVIAKEPENIAIPLVLKRILGGYQQSLHPGMEREDLLELQQQQDAQYDAAQLAAKRDRGVKRKKKATNKVAAAEESLENQLVEPSV